MSPQEELPATTMLLLVEAAVAVACPLECPPCNTPTLPTCMANFPKWVIPPMVCSTAMQGMDNSPLLLPREGISLDMPTRA